MTRQLAAGLGLLVVTVALLLMLVFSVIHRAVRHRRERRHEQELRRVRPELVAIAAEEPTEQEEEAAFEQMASVDRSILEEAAMDMLAKLRGDSHDRIVGVLERRGLLESAQERLHSSKAEVRARSAMLIGAAGYRPAVDDLVRLLDDPVQDVALAAARSVGRLHDPSAVEPLLACLDEVPGLPAGVVSMSLLRIGRDAADPLQEGLVSAGPIGRMTSAEVLGRLGIMGATNALIAALEGDPVPDVRIRCARALGRIGSPRATDPLADTMVSTDDVGLRTVCARALGEVGDDDTVALLGEAVRDPHHAAALAAAQALVSLDPPGMEELDGLARAPGQAAAYAREVLALARLRASGSGRSADTS